MFIALFFSFIITLWPRCACTFDLILAPRLRRIRSLHRQQQNAHHQTRQIDGCFSVLFREMLTARMFICFAHERISQDNTVIKQRKEREYTETPNTVWMALRDLLIIVVLVVRLGKSSL